MTLAEEIRTMVHAFSDEGRRAGVRELAARVAGLESQLSAATARASELEIRAHESRALLQRMAKYVREDRATTAGSTRLERLTVQVTDYLQRTHDPRSILRGGGEPTDAARAKRQRQ